MEIHTDQILQVKLYVPSIFLRGKNCCKIQCPSSLVSPLRRSADPAGAGRGREEVSDGGDPDERVLHRGRRPLPGDVRQLGRVRPIRHQLVVRRLPRSLARQRLRRQQQERQEKEAEGAFTNL